MNILAIESKSQWEQFIWAQSDNSFFQSWNWGNVQMGLGRKVWRLGTFQASQLVGVCQVVKVEAKRGAFLFLRHGPLLKDWNGETLRFFIREISTLGLKEGAHFLRMNPLLPCERSYERMLKKAGFMPSAMHNIDAEVDWRIDLSRGENELLANMRKNTRNLIHRSEKDGVQVQFSQSAADISDYLTIHFQTVARQGYMTEFGRREIALEFQQFSVDNQAVLALARYKGDVLAGAVVLFNGKKAIYHHAATGDNPKKVPASYGLLWEIIKYSKARGLSWLHLWGIAPTDDPKHPWAGLTFFKKGFGGERTNLIHLRDKPLSWRYYLIYIYETYERFRRGY